MTKYDICDMIKAPIHPMGADCALLHKRRLAHFLANLIREGVVLMGSGRWTKVLRYVVWAIVAFALMVATAQKAC